MRADGIDRAITEHKIDALIAPTGPGAWLIDAVNGDFAPGMTSTPAAVAGYPHITVPAGFTTAVWDRVADGNGGTRLSGPVPASLPVGVDFIARPFGEPLLFRIASAYEAATRQRRPPPDFGPVEGRGTK